MSDKIPIEELPAGTDVSDLYADQNERTVIIPYKNKQWELSVRELTWAEHQTIASRMAQMRITNGKSADATMNILEGHIAHLLKAIKKAPFPITRAFFLQVSPAFGRLLVKYVIESAPSEDEEKNSEQPSRDET
jgi:hypothetical protein